MAGRNPKGSGTIRKRKDGRWEGMFTIGTDPGTGKQIRKSVYGKTQAEASQKLRKAVAEIDEGTYQEPSKLTVAAWLDIWLEEYTSNLKPLSHKAYEKRVRYNIKPGLGAIKLTKLSAHHIQSFYNKLHKEQGLSPKTISLVHGVLHKALEKAISINYIRTNPANACTLPRIEKPKIKPLDDDAIGRFMQAIKEHRFERIFLIDLFTGLRQSELLGLTWDCIDFEQGTMNIYRQMQRIDKIYRFVPLKNNNTRLLSPAQTVMKALREQKQIQLEWQVKSYGLWDNPDDLVFTNEVGSPIPHSTVYKDFKKICAQIGIPNARFHDLRHSYAVAALRAGDDVKTVQESLGHHTAAFTLDTYAHVTEQMRKESAERMERFIKGING